MPQQTIRHDWTDAEIGAIYNLPFMELVFRAQQVHRSFHDPNKVQVATLLSIKTGGCSEDCAYCSQSGHHKTGLKTEQLLGVDEVVAKARQAQQRGSSRFCMGAAWRAVRNGNQFETVLEMVRQVSALGLEVCCTLGMLTQEQAQRLADAGLTAYNHNLDTGPEHYDRIAKTHSFADRLQTLSNIRRAGINLCCGGIIGLGERVEDRIALLGVLARMEHPESVPINSLVPIPGTPLQDATPVSSFEVVRMIAATRIVMPASRIRLSAGRAEMSAEAQALCFVAGANAIFAGDKLLTAPNADRDEDMALLAELDLSPMDAA